MPIPAVVYGVGAGLAALGSYLGGKSQADAVKDQNEQNKQLTYQSWDRDDTAVTRRTHDLVQAGLNPALAAGSAAGNTAPLQMQAAADTGPGQALQSAGQNISAAPTVLNALKRSAAQTVQAEAQAALTGQQARIAKMDADSIEAGNDPRDKTPINQLIKLLPRLVQNLGPGGAMREAGKKAGQWVDDLTTKMAAPDVAASKAASAEADVIIRKMKAAMDRGDIDTARRMRDALDDLGRRK